MSEFNTENKEAQNDYNIIVSIANDYYKAFITVEVHSASVVVTMDSLLTALKAKNIVYGYDKDALEAIVSDPYHAVNIPVAIGTPHINGVDGEITYLFDTEMKLHPTINPDGSVDFKQMNFLHLAYKGDILANRTLPTQGEDGMTVTGKIIKAKPGKPKNFKVGKNVEVIEDGLSIQAAETGNIEFNGERVSIIKVLEIKGDVGINTGDIEFAGKVSINGNVTTGYKIHSDEGIEVNGIVECAELYSGGDILISGGVQGNDAAILQAKGNIITKFLNNCTVTANGDIEADAILHCHITCDGSITVKGKRGLLVGGEINVRKEINAKTIGSEMGTLTKLRLGIDSKIMDEYQNASSEVNEIRESITKLNQASKLLNKQYENSQSQEIKAMLDKTNVSLQDYITRYEMANKNLKDLGEMIESLKGSKINCETIYPGVKIRIGSTYYNVKDPLKDISIMKEDGEIRTSALIYKGR